MIVSGTEPVTESIKPGRELVERTATLTLLEKRTQDVRHRKIIKLILYVIDYIIPL